MTLIRFEANHRMSQAVRAGNLVFLAGQIPDKRDADISDQTCETLAKIDRILNELGGDKSNLVSVQIWLHDMKDFAGMNAAWDAWVDTTNPPARATGGVALASAPSGVKIEIIATAHIPVTDSNGLDGLR